MLKHVSYLQVQLAKNRHSIRSPDGVRQRDPQPDLYVRAMGLFVQSLAACYLQKRAFDQKRSQYRGRAFEEAADAQTLEIVANLQAGFEVYLDFCVEAGAITKTERDELADRCWAALQETAQPQAEHQAEIAPTRRFSPSCVLWCHPAGLIWLSGTVGSRIGTHSHAAGGVTPRADRHRSVYSDLRRLIGWRNRRRATRENYSRSPDRRSKKAP